MFNMNWRDNMKELSVMGVFRKFGAGIKEKYPIVKLTKLEDGENPKYAPNHPRHIKIGTIAEGLMLRPVKVGESFYVDYPTSPNHFHTSIVMEILPDNVFRTMNSIYKYEILK